MEGKPSTKPGRISSGLKKSMADVGPLGIIMFLGAAFVVTSLLKDDMGSLGSLANNQESSAQTSVEEKHKEQITALFESIEGVTVDSINISYKSVADTSSALFSSSQETVSNGVVIVYQGTIKAPYDVTHAISLLLDVPIHQITLLKASEL